MCDEAQTWNALIDMATRQATLVDKQGSQDLLTES